MISSMYGKVLNENGEVVAEGACEVDSERGSVTLRPLLDMPLLERQRGLLRLTLDTGQELLLTDRVIHFKVNLPGERPGSVYRLYIARQQGLNPWPRSSSDLQVARGGDEGAGGRLQGSEHDPTRNPDDLPPEFRKDDGR